MDEVDAEVSAGTAGGESGVSTSGVDGTKRSAIREATTSRGRGGPQRGAGSSSNRSAMREATRARGSGDDQRVVDDSTVLSSSVTCEITVEELTSGEGTLWDPKHLGEAGQARRWRPLRQWP
ncbi:unnamed protein product [Peronospora effusa]|uniref:Uncharacterized protein n=1 Tax=Peronospora effusa TaxID=542832 RepID=A0A3M6V7W9_9STRA|nr:hypothetical protein DD238_008312 [Peronospora effusa]RQM10917.1 hypothetical protein DD237_008286 [Peronospora effusa]CAI5700996.1 unnamed protein product [Peronospora effusa]